MSFATYRNRNFVNFLKIIHIKYELILKNTRQSTMNNKSCYICSCINQIMRQYEKNICNFIIGFSVFQCHL